MQLHDMSTSDEEAKDQPAVPDGLLVFRSTSANNKPDSDGDNFRGPLGEVNTDRNRNAGNGFRTKTVLIENAG